MDKLTPVRFAWTFQHPCRPSGGLAVALALLLLTGCATLGSETGPAKGQPMAPALIGSENYVRGRQHLSAGRFGLALSEFRRALRRDPGSVPTLNAMAISYDLLGRPDLAQAHYERALAYDPQSAQTVNNFGRSLLRQGRPHLALAYFERAAELGADDPIIQSNLELARSLSAGADDSPPPYGRAGPGRPAVWVERSTSHAQTLVTSGPEAGSQVDPAVVHVAAAEVTPSLGVALARDVTLEVSNGAGRRHMAARFRSFLANHGLRATRLTNASHFRFENSVIFCRPGFEAAARQLASLLPGGVTIEPGDDQAVDVRLRLGADLLGFDTDLLARNVES